MELLDDANQIAADEATFDCLGVLPTDLLEDVLLRLAMDKDKDSLTSCMCSSSTWRVFASRLVPTRLVANGRGALHSYPRHAPAIQRLCLGMPSAGSAASFLLANAAAAGPAKLASVTEVDIMASCYSPAVFDALPLACPALSRIHAHADGNNVGKLSVILAGVHSLGPGRIRELRINTDPGRVKRALMAIRAPATTPVAAAILQLTWLTCLELPHVKMEAGPVRALVGGLPALKHLALHSLRSSVAEEARPLAPSALRTLALRYIPSLRHLQWLPREVSVVHDGDTDVSWTITQPPTQAQTAAVQEAVRRIVPSPSAKSARIMLIFDDAAGLADADVDVIAAVEPLVSLLPRGLGLTGCRVDASAVRALCDCVGASELALDCCSMAADAWAALDDGEFSVLSLRGCANDGALAVDDTVAADGVDAADNDADAADLPPELAFAASVRRPGLTLRICFDVAAEALAELIASIRADAGLPPLLLECSVPDEDF